ncbi:MAG: ABC transporter transmembrane domain-containing protein, partial [Actinomycetota bacterium]
MSFTRGVQWLLALGMVCALGMTATSLAIPWLVGVWVDRLREALQESTPLEEVGLWGLAGGVIGLAALQFVFASVRRLCTNYVGHTAEYRIRRKLFEQMLRLSHAFYDRASTGELVSRGISDLRVIKHFVGGGLFQLFLSVITVLVVSAVLFYKDPRLAAMVLVPMPFLSLAAWRFASKVHPIFRAVQSRLADMTTSVQ